MPTEVRLQVDRCLGGAGPDDEVQSRVVELTQVGGGQHAGVGDDHEPLQGVALTELVHDRDQGKGLFADPVGITS